LSTISLEEAAQVEPLALRLVIDREARCCREVEPSIVAVDGVVKLAGLGGRNFIVLGPHHPCQHLENGEGARPEPAGPLWEGGQNRCGEPWVGVRAREESAIEDENPSNFRAAYRFAPLGALKPALQVLQNDKGGKVEGDERSRLDAEIAPDRLDKIGAFGGGVRIVFGLVAVAHADILDEELWHLVRVR